MSSPPNLHNPNRTSRPAPANDAALSRPIALTGALLNVLLGILPSVAFFAWVAHGCALPVFTSLPSWLRDFLQLPWAFFPDWGLPAQLAWNGSWFALFALAHTAFAQEAFQERWFGRVPSQLRRTAYMAITGSLLFLMMAFWQSSGIIVWILPLPQGWLTSHLGGVIFGAFMACTVFLGSSFDAFRFVGLKQIFLSRAAASEGTTGNPELKTTGLYGWVRHPIYFFTLLAFACAPVMSLDRLWVLALTLAYLCIGVPIEERKLVALFGDAYVQYRRKVPAFLPFLR